MDLREGSKDNGIDDEDSERLPEMSESFTHHITHHLTSYDVAYMDRLHCTAYGLQLG